MRRAIAGAVFLAALGVSAPARADCLSDVGSALLAAVTGGASCAVDTAMNLIANAKGDAEALKASATTDFNREMDRQRQVMAEGDASRDATAAQIDRYAGERIHQSILKMQSELQLRPAMPTLAPLKPAPIAKGAAVQPSGPQAPALKTSPTIATSPVTVAPVTPATIDEVSYEELLAMVERLAASDNDNRAAIATLKATLAALDREKKAEQTQRESALRDSFDGAVTAPLDGAIASMAAIDPAGALALYEIVRSQLDQVRAALTGRISADAQEKAKKLEIARERERTELRKRLVVEQDLMVQVLYAQEVISTRKRKVYLAWLDSAGIKPPHDPEASSVLTIPPGLMRVSGPPPILFRQSPVLAHIAQMPAQVPHPTQAAIQAELDRRFDLAFRNQLPAVAATHKAELLRQANTIADPIVRAKAIALVNQGAAARGVL